MAGVKCALHGVASCPLCDPVFMVPVTLCPTCGYVMDAVGIVGGTCERYDTGEPARPAEGDISGCLACGARLIFGPAPALQARLMTDEEFAALDADQQRDLEQIRAFAQTGWYGKAHPYPEPDLKGN